MLGSQAVSREQNTHRAPENCLTTRTRRLSEAILILE